MNHALFSLIAPSPKQQQSRDLLSIAITSLSADQPATAPKQQQSRDLVSIAITSLSADQLATDVRCSKLGENLLVQTALDNLVY